MDYIITNSVLIVLTKKEAPFCNVIEQKWVMYKHKTILWADTGLHSTTFLVSRERERERGSISEAHCFADFEACEREREGSSRTAQVSHI